jgi:hypothetical protein
MSKEKKIEREIIKLTSDQVRDIVFENYLEINDVDIPIEGIETKYIKSGRHQEYHTKVFQRLTDKKYFIVNYSTSVKDNMGWEECNYGPFKATEVFPEVISKTIYK